MHVPFCKHRCGYCNFAVIAGRDDLADGYLAALEHELAWLGGPHPVDTLFIGGGTPTQLDDEHLERLLEIVLRSFELAAGGEFSVEANPGDVTEALACRLARAGVNRISLGAQSFRADKLALLERDHEAQGIVRAATAVRQAGATLALDLIFGVPGETAKNWCDDLRAALLLAPDHVSTYGLTFERGTRFWARRLRDELRPVPEAAERDMYEAAISLLVNAGFEHYEVSNFARPGHRSRHNETYWTGRTYFAVGPGAARHVAGRREVNHRSPKTYIRRLLEGRSPVAESESLTPEDAARERFVFGMRRLEGVRRHEFAAETGFPLDDLFAAPLACCVEQGLFTDVGDTVRLTREGLLVSDALWPMFL